MCKELSDNEVVKVTGGTSEQSGDELMSLIADYLRQHNLLVGTATDSLIKETLSGMSLSQIADLKVYILNYYSIESIPLWLKIIFSRQGATSGYNTEIFITDILDTIKL